MSSNLRANFEKQLRDKLVQKTSSFQSEESILIKNFRFFDLDNSGDVDFDEFKKALEKIGVQVASPQQYRQLFDMYDTNKNGVLEYKEFAAIVFGNASPITRQLSPETKKAKYKDTTVAGLLDKLRTTLRKRGASVLALAKQFAYADRNNSRTLDREEFRMVSKTFGTGLDERETDIIFDHFDANRSGQINYDEYIFAIVGEMNSFRRKLVEQAFNKIDRDQSGDITIDELRHFYNTSLHPDVRAGRKTENQVLTEFLKTFETLYDYERIGDDKVTKDEFIEYYNFVSASIEGDHFFETMINNAWKINEGATGKTKEAAWANKYEAGKQSTVNKGAYSTLRAEESARQRQGLQQGGRDQGERVKKSAVPQNVQNPQEVVEGALHKLRSKMYQRGAKAFIGLQRQFKIMDDDNDKAISYSEFSKALNEYKLGFTEEECRALFHEFDVDGSGKISIDEFVRGVRGEMNDFRRNLVKQAFNVLDRDGDGVIRVNDIKTIYSAKNHPDVRSGRRTESDILGEFLETFETHHNVRKGTRDQNVTLEEFIEYYNNVGANIDDDRFFETMIQNGYKLGQQTSYGSKQAWGQSYKGEEPKKNRNLPPYGVSDVPTDYHTTSQRPQTAQPSYQRGRTEQQGSQRDQQSQQSNRSEDTLITLFREKVAARGSRGIFSLARLFKVIDDDNSGALSLEEFQKAINDLRFNFTNDETRRLFAIFDINRNGSIDYDEFLRQVRGPMNQNRVHWVREAFKKLDRDGSGIINLDDLRGVYSAKQHPDVKSGRKTEDEILVEFLDTFEQHHAIITGDPKLRDAQVTFEEFLEYYNNVSSSIDDDRYFEAMMKSAWKLNAPTSYGGQQGFRNDYGRR